MDRIDILTRACELYLEGGAEAVSMRRLARDLGVTAPALYRHYDSREEMLLDVVAEAYRRLSERLYGALSGRTPAERLYLAGQAYLDFALDQPKYYEMLYTPATHPRGGGVSRAGDGAGGQRRPPSSTTASASASTPASSRRWTPTTCPEPCGPTPTA